MLPKIAIIGYGQMGKEIEKFAKEKNFEITDIFDVDSPIDINKNYDFDVAIDFTVPTSALSNLQKISQLKKNLVIGTTGWYEQKAQFIELVSKNEIGVVWASNFSIGVQMFFKIIKSAAEILNIADDYDIAINEIHHKRKKDSPSGTAHTIGNIILENYKKKKSQITNPAEHNYNYEQLITTCMRLGEVTGTHSVLIDSTADTIELTHRAKNRSGFALGALKAAELIHGKSGFYEFSDLI